MTNDATTRHPLCLLAVWPLLLAPMAATAAPPDADPFAGLPALGGGELQAARGGMTIGGLSIDFAVVVETTAHAAGQAPMGLQTTLAVSDAGHAGTATTTPVGTTPAGTTPVGTTPVASPTLPQTLTHITQDVGRDQVLTTITNAANGMSITQRTDLNVSLPNFLVATRTFSLQSQSARMGLEAALAGLGHR